MIFNGMLKAEVLFFHSESDANDTYFVEIGRDCEDGTLYVRSCCDDEWEWRFYDKASNYELVKHAIFDVAFDSHNMAELINGLDEVFEDIFEAIVVCDKCSASCDCETGCKHCGCK